MSGITASYPAEPAIARHRVDLDLMDEEFDLLAEVCDDPHDQDTDYGRGYLAALTEMRSRIDRRKPAQFVEILDDLIRVVSGD